MADESTITEGGETDPIPFDEPKKRGPGRPPKIVDLEESIKEAPISPEGVSFFIGEIAVLKFSDKTTYHVKRNRVTTSDPKLIANLKEAAKNPTNKIFIDEL